MLKKGNGRFALRVIRRTGIYSLPVTISATDMIARYLFKFIKKMQYTAVVVADGGQAGELAVQLADY